MTEQKLTKFIFTWLDSYRTSYQLPIDTLVLRNKIFSLGLCGEDLPEKTVGLTIDGFTHDNLTTYETIIARFKLIKETPFEAQLQFYILKDPDTPVVLGIIFCDLVIDTEKSESHELLKPPIDTKTLKIKNLVYYRFDKKQISFFRDGTLLYEFSNTKLRTTDACPSFLFDYGLVEYNIPLIKTPPNHEHAHLSPLYTAIHPSQSEQKCYKLPVFFTNEVYVNMLRYMLDADFTELYAQWINPKPKCSICGPKKQFEIERQTEAPSCIHMTLCLECVRRLAKIQLDKSAFNKKINH